MKSRHGVAILFLVAAAVLYTYSQHTSSMPQAIASSTPGTVSLITEPDESTAPITSMIESASSSVDVVMYEFEDPAIEQVLADDASRGVHVRVLLNGGYYGKKENKDNDAAYQFLSAHGVQIQWTPAYFALTHQKTIVVDGKDALIMTLNFTPQYYATSRDFALSDTDSNDVTAIEQAFTDDWNGTHTTASNGDDLVWSPGSEGALVDLINSATSSLDIYNEEMADTAVTNALERAAQRGVKVRVAMTYSNEWKPAFTGLSSAGAQVRTYAANAPLYIHAKVILADGARAFLGSENFSSGSLEKNRELGIMVSDPSTIASLKTTFQKDWEGATVFQQ